MFRPLYFPARGTPSVDATDAKPVRAESGDNFNMKRRLDIIWPAEIDQYAVCCALADALGAPKKWRLGRSAFEKKQKRSLAAKLGWVRRRATPRPRQPKAATTSSREADHA